MKKIIVDKNDLATVYPALAQEWDYNRNDKRPEEYTPKSNQSVYWKCSKCGYSYKAKISNRAIGRACPCCTGKVAVAGINDLTTTHPHLAAEWHRTKNKELSPAQVTAGRAAKVWWQCPEGHEYQASILHRSHGTGCPKCYAGRQTSFAEQAVFFYVKKAFPDAISRYTDIFNNGMELDIYIPSIRLGIEYDGFAWHKEHHAERERRKYEICQRNNIKLLRIKESQSNADSFNADYSLSMDKKLYKPQNLAKAIRYILDKIDPVSNMWTRKHPLSFHSPVDINIPRDEMEIRSYMTKLRTGSLAENFPQIAKEWHPTKNGTVTPEKVSPYSDAKVFWLCPICNQEYYASIGHRCAGTGCPKCGIIKSAQARSKRVQMIDPNSQKVLKIFASISEASRQTGISSGNISAVCKGSNRKQAGGYIWKYADE
ncbi:MAG: hypothetical protein IJC70_01005 [Firmicutes bacterium]|nr:hypothetical protein [Bacillota bacterium]